MSRGGRKRERAERTTEAVVTAAAGIVRQRAHLEGVPHVQLGLLLLGVELGVGTGHEGEGENDLGEHD